MIEVSQQFTSFEALQSAVQDLSIQQKFAFRTQLRDKQRVDYRCAAKRDGCPWGLYATEKDESVRVRIFHIEHACLGAGMQSHQTANRQSWLLREVPDLIIVTRTTKPIDIIDAVRLHRGEQISYQAAHQVKMKLVNAQADEQARQFELLPAYLQTLQQQSPYVKTALLVTEHRLEENTAFFRRVFICPAESQLSFIQARKFIALDGTFLKAHFQQTLLLAACVDANNHYLLLAWAVVESENTESWRWFLNHLKNAIPQILDASIISDRDKGLLAAEDTLGNNVVRLFCLEHLRRNFIKSYSREYEGLFWRIANATTVDEYQTAITLLQLEKPSAALYLEEIDPQIWISAFIPGRPSRRYGQKTSNAVEVMNQVLRNARELSIVDLLMEVWHTTMKIRFRRANEANAVIIGQTFTPFCHSILQHERENALRNTVRIADNYHGLVQSPAQIAYVVDLERRTCTCHHFQDTNIPCQHGIACILTLRHRIDSYIPYEFLVNTWKRTYSHNFPPIILPEHLRHPAAPAPIALQHAPQPQLNPHHPHPHPAALHYRNLLPGGLDVPEVRVVAPPGRRVIGRQKKSRAVSGGRNRASGSTEQICGSCRKSGHNSRSCRIRTHM